MFFKDKQILNHENQSKLEVQSTDLSTLLINGHMLDENIKHMDTRTFKINCENGEFFIQGLTNDNKGLCKVLSISAILGNGTTISYKNKEITTTQEIKMVLGENYVEGIPLFGDVDTITYVDKNKNIEFIIGSEKNIYLKKIENISSRIAATPIISNNFFDPIDVFFSLKYSWSSNYLYNPNDFIAVPLYLAIFFLPIVALFTEKDKYKRHKWIIANISLGAVYLIVWLYNFFQMLLGV